MTHRRQRPTHPPGPMMHQSRATTAELYRASTALVIPFLRSLAERPVIDRIQSLRACADTEVVPQTSIKLLIKCETSFQASILRAIDN